MPLVAVPDTCVLFPASLRDAIFLAASAQVFRMRLTDDILDELNRNLPLYLVKKGRTPEAASEATGRLLTKIREAFDEAIIDNHKKLIDKMPVNAKDRHVMAAAVASSAQIIVTQNLKDFPKHLLEHHNIKAQSPDDFLTDLFYDNTEGMINVIIKQSWNLRNPPHSVSEVLDTLKLHAPIFSNLIRRGLDLMTDYERPVHVEVNSDTSQR